MSTAFPCEPLVAPDNGAVACNGWNGRFGEVCTVLCQETRELSPGEDISRLYVCGASGKWSLKMDIGACSGTGVTSVCPLLERLVGVLERIKLYPWGQTIQPNHQQRAQHINEAVDMVVLTFPHK